MVFTAVKLAQILLLPPAICLLLMAAGFFISFFCRIFGRLLLAAGIVSLYLFSISPVSDALLQPLESRYALLTADQQDRIKGAQAIVVLGGGVHNAAWLGREGGIASETSVDRVVAGITLWRASKLPLLLVGGSGEPGRSKESEADAMAATAAGLGVPEKELVVVRGPRNTLESAQEVRKKLRGNRIILVTTACHMKRAEALFKKQGFEVVPAPTGYRSEMRQPSLFAYLPRAAHLHSSYYALSEHLAFAWYTVTRDL